MGHYSTIAGKYVHRHTSCERAAHEALPRTPDSDGVVPPAV